MAVVALFLTPMLTMRLFAEEKRQGTIELLATSPITDLQIVLGKFLAAAGLYALMIVAGLVNVALVSGLRDDPARVEAGRSPAPSPSSCSGSLLHRPRPVRLDPHQEPDRGRHPVLLPLPRHLDPRLGGRSDRRGRSTKVVAYLGVTTHMEDLVKGVLDLKDVVFYLSFIAFGLFLAHQSVESQRWRA